VANDSEAEVYKAKVYTLKRALLGFLGSNGRHYTDMDRMEQSIEDLAQALNTRLDQQLMKMEQGVVDPEAVQSPKERLASRFMDTAVKLANGGRVDKEMADQFEQAIDMFDIAADLKRQAMTAKDAAETAAIKHKRER